MTTTDTTTTAAAAAATRSRKPIIIAMSAAAAALLIAGGGYAITGAAFTHTETVTGNSVGTATLKIGDTVSAPVSVSDLLPGQNVRTPNVITFSNAGTVPFRYTVEIANVVASAGSPSELLGWVPVTLTSGNETASGTLAALPTLSLGSTAVGGTGAVDVAVGLSTDATNSAQTRTVTFDIVVTAEQR